MYWSGFLLYAVVVITIGFKQYQLEKKACKTTDNEEYWTAGYNLSGWAVGFSISASMMSVSWSGMYGVQLFYWYGPGGMWLLIVPWLLTMALFYFFAPRFRTLKIFSQPELMHRHFGTSSRLVMAFTLLFVFIAWGGAEIYAAGKIIAPFLDISPPTAFFLIACVVALYSYSGGFAAVVATDKIQFFLVAFFMSAVAWLAFDHTQWDIATLESLAPPRQEAGQSVWLAPGLLLIVMTLVAYLPGWLVETDLWVRIQSAKTNREARRGIVIAALNSFVFVGIIPAVIGISALQLFPAENGIIPPYLQDGALIFTEVLARYAPVWLNLILSVGLVAAAMSTVDTCGNIVALSLSRDVLEPYFEKKHWDRQRLNRLARWSSVGAVGLALLYALFTESLWDIFYLSSGLLTTVVFIPVISVFIKRPSKWEVNAAMLVGLTATFLFYFLEKSGWSFGWPALKATGLGYIFWAFCASVISGIIVRYFRE